MRHEGPAFWERHLDVFEPVTVATRTMTPKAGHPTIEGPRLTVATVYGNVVVARRGEGIAASGHVTMPEFFGSGPIEGSR